MNLKIESQPIEASQIHSMGARELNALYDTPELIKDSGTALAFVEREYQISLENLNEKLLAAQDKPESDPDLLQNMQTVINDYQRFLNPDDPSHKEEVIKTIKRNADIDSKNPRAPFWKHLASFFETEES